MTIKNLSEIKSENLGAVNTLLDTAKTKITFWGSRVIQLGDYEGTLESVAEQILGIGRQCTDKNFAPSLRLVGMEINRKLANLYLGSDQQVKDCNFFTRFLVWLREPAKSDEPQMFETTRVRIEQAMVFRTYTAENFLIAFGTDPGCTHIAVCPESIRELEALERDAATPVQAGPATLSAAAATTIAAP